MWLSLVTQLLLFSAFSIKPYEHLYSLIPHNNISSCCTFSSQFIQFGQSLNRWTSPHTASFLFGPPLHCNLLYCACPAHSAVTAALIGHLLPWRLYTPVSSFSMLLRANTVSEIPVLHTEPSRWRTTWPHVISTLPRHRTKSGGR